MGFFSWKTADTNESIANCYSNKECRPTYLLQPNGKEPILEAAYEGYGNFGGVDAYEWLVENNLSKKDLKGFSGERRSLGISLELGNYYESSNGEFFACSDSVVYLTERLVNVKPKQFGNYGSSLMIDGVTSSVNEHISSKRLIKHDLSNFIKSPLIFSFNPKAIYEDLDKSLSCEFQGFFYSE